ncbi:MAG: protein kinase domain-containing protein, partial [Vicinamibacterales bacterium]
RVIERLGAGGMGVVYRARDERLDRDVALKVLPPGRLEDEDARRRFKKEALALSRINHPQIATIHDFDTDAGVDFLVMEFIPGKGLDQLAAEGGLSDDAVRQLGIQLADGLAALHQHGMVHRDLKPSNLRLTPDGRLKILDFGLARLLQPVTSVVTETFDSAVEFAGTLPYMAPEQVKGEPIDARTDIYAAGAVLYELATGRRLFPDAGRAELVGAILGRTPAKPKSINPQLSDSLERTIVRALAKDPTSRPATAADLRVALTEKGVRPLEEPAEPGPRERSIAVSVIAGVLALLVLMILATVVIRRIGSAPPPIVGKTTVAVLPFHALSVSPPIRFLGVGIPDAIITRLAGVEQLTLRPTNAILRYENQPVDPKDAGRALKSAYVLTGILQEAEERLRVSVQLVQVEDGAPLWGEHYDVARADLLSLQDQIARSVADALKIQMTAAERHRLFRRYTENAAAYEKYLEGRAQFSRYTPDSTRAAIASFEEALKVDPAYAPARAGVALASASMRLRFAPASEALAWSERAEREARAALELDPQLAEAHEALAGVYRAVEFKWEETIEEGRLALALNPNLDQPYLYRAAAFYHLGLLDLVEPALKAAADVNPGLQQLAVESQRTRGITALLAGRFQDAIDAFEDVHRMSGGTTYNWLRGQAFYYTGDAARAEEILALGGNTASDRRSQAVLASVKAARDADTESKALVHTILDGGFIDHHIAYSLGATYAQLGDFGEARRWLEEAARTGLPCYPWFARDPLLDPLRRDPEFQRFLAGLEESWRKRIVRYTTATR